MCGALDLIEKRFGQLSLDTLHHWNNARCFEFLCSLPGVSVKTAACVMLYTLDREIFPSDVHCNRILARLGVLPAEYGRPDKHKKAQRLLLDGRIPSRDVVQPARLPRSSRTGNLHVGQAAVSSLSTSGLLCRVPPTGVITVESRSPETILRRSVLRSRRDEYRHLSPH